MESVRLEIGPEGATSDSHKEGAIKFISSRLAATIEDIDAMVAELERNDCYLELTKVLHVRRRYELLKRINDYDL